MMNQVNYIIVVLLFSAVYTEDVAIQEDKSEDNARQIREFNQEGWRAVEIFPEGDLGWIPRDDTSDSDQIKPKRRRLRKRKRRPQIPENTDGEILFPRRRIRPYRLETIAQPWEMLEENMKPNSRRRIPLPYSAPEDIDKDNNNEENVKKADETKPLEASILIEDTDDKTEPQMMHNSLTDLKNLLKQSGGKLSLSELLQQKNISLTELLQGNEKAISALTETSQKPPPTTGSTSEKSTKYRRLPPSIGLKNSPKNSFQEASSEESLTEIETLEAQRKRLALLKHKENKIFANVIKFDVITEPTTERRIFIPANPKYSKIEYTSDSSKEGEIDITTERKIATSTPSTATYTSPASISTTTEKKIENVSTLNLTTKIMKSRGKLPTTNAKLKFTTKKENLIEKENYPLAFEIAKPIKININEVTGFKNQNVNRKEEISVNEEKTDGPMRVSIDLEMLFEKNNKSDRPPIIIQSPLKEPEISIFKEPEITTNMSDQNETYVTAQQEIMEVMKDPTSREKLSRILESRNMTLEELVEQRERGSSQLHLADIFHNKTREPEPKDEPFIGHISAEVFQNMRTTNRQPKSTKFDDLIKISTTDAPTSTIKMVTSKRLDHFPTVTVKFNKNPNEGIDPFPWKQLYPDLFPDSNEEIQDTDSENHYDNEIIQRIDLESSFNSEPEEGFLSSIPSGVKSALFVSLAIVGLSIAVFLAILVVFRWTQRKNRSINYCSSLTTRLKSPIILQGRPTTAIKTFMNETLGRKRITTNQVCKACLTKFGILVEKEKNLSELKAYLLILFIVFLFM